MFDDVSYIYIYKWLQKLYSTSCHRSFLKPPTFSILEVMAWLDLNHRHLFNYNRKPMAGPKFCVLAANYSCTKTKSSPLIFEVKNLHRRAAGFPEANLVGSGISCYHLHPSTPYVHFDEAPWIQASDQPLSGLWDTTPVNQVCPCQSCKRDVIFWDLGSIWKLWEALRISLTVMSCRLIFPGKGWHQILKHQNARSQSVLVKDVVICYHLATNDGQMEITSLSRRSAIVGEKMF